MIATSTSPQVLLVKTFRRVHIRVWRNRNWCSNEGESTAKVDIVGLTDILCGRAGARGSGTHKAPFSSPRKTSRKFEILRSEKAEVDLEKERVSAHVRFHENEKTSHASERALSNVLSWWGSIPDHLILRPLSRRPVPLKQPCSQQVPPGHRETAAECYSASPCRVLICPCWGHAPQYKDAADE